MGVDISIRQGIFKKKKIDFAVFEELLNENNFYCGISNSVYVTEEYSGDDKINDLYFVVFSNNYGRGFTFYLDKNDNIEVRLNIPSTKSDIKEFYCFVKTLCNYLNLDSFIQDGEKQSLADIEMLNERIEKVCQENLVDFIQEMDDLVIFGSMFPVVLEDYIIKEILASDDSLEVFERYLKEKNELDCYFAKPIIYQDDDGNVFGVYVVPEDCQTIFPLEAGIPFGYTLPDDLEISEWCVDVGGIVDNEYETLAKLKFDEFQDMIDFTKLEAFDKKHIILNINREQLKK